MPITGLPFDEATRRLIARVADGFLPLSEWVSSKKYIPAEPTPWRQTGRALNATSLSLIEFFEGLLRETSGDSDLKARWDAFAKNPLGRCPTPDALTWRANRGLVGDVRFAITASDAVMVDVETREISRAEFYAPYWTLLASAYKTADATAQGAGTTVDEKDFAAKMLSDKNQFWPAGGQWRSSRFSKQFVKDVLYCYLGLRGSAPKPWAEAVLAELGEFRRVGNRYTSSDCRAAIEKLNKVLADLRHQKEAHPLAAPGREYVLQPIGSPPVNARDL
jgi:hypothetical protein